MSITVHVQLSRLVQSLIRQRSKSNYMRLCMRKPTIRFPNRSETNRSVQSQKQARCSKFRVKEDEGLYYLRSENKGADQLCSCCTADLRLCFHLCKLLVFLMRWLISNLCPLKSYQCRWD